MSLETEIQALKARVAELEARLDDLCNHPDVEHREDNSMRDSKIIELIGKGNVIEAIKVYRETYNVSLADAKHAVDTLKAGLGM
jgi:ribosomal protein L7/L12